jgi:protein-S-isoprenylcysteine O-methyltransferase Ste14
MSGQRGVDQTRTGAVLRPVSVPGKARDSVSAQEAALREEFHRQYDVSYVAPGLPRPPAKQALKHYLASALVYGTVLLFYTINPYFHNQLSIEFANLKGWPALRMYYYAYAAYLAICPLAVFWGRPRSLWVSKNLRIVGYFSRLVFRRDSQRDLRPTYEEKHALMFLLIKIIYGPLMILNVIGSCNAIGSVIEGAKGLPSWAPLAVWCDVGYELLFYVVFLLDPMVFVIGYHSESGLLRNKLRYAETNLFHILVCLACYPPFNQVPVAILGPSTQDFRILWGAHRLMDPMTWVLRGAGVFFLLLLLSASLSLFTRGSNLTNRGIVDWGPYRFVRHPGYFAKNMFWLLTLIPFFVPNKADPMFTWPAYTAYCARLIIGLLGWGTLYFLRSITEERFLMRDPDYVAYCKKVRYRFIPGVY